jgi:RHS repeat-associated protein
MREFDYDKFGNLYRKNASNPTAGQENPIGFVSIEDADINKATNRFTTQTTYDDAGNVITDNKFRTSNFAYDANGRMIKATKASLPDATSIYDASGMRVAEQVNDVWRFLIYDIGGKLIAEYGGLQATDEGGVKYLLSDWQGSTRAVLSNSGYVSSRMDYQAFGEDISAGTGIRTTAQGFNSSNNLRQKYGLTERDEATGLDHTWFRKNEQKAGRWTSPDPYNGSMSLGNPQSFNRYSYVGNQPTNFVDPSGLQLRYFDVSQGMSCVLMGDG